MTVMLRKRPQTGPEEVVANRSHGPHHIALEIDGVIHRALSARHLYFDAYVAPTRLRSYMGEN